MTDNEILLLASGINFGIYLTLAVHFAGALADDRRDRRAIQAALARQIKNHAVRDWRDALAKQVKA